MNKQKLSLFQQRLVLSHSNENFECIALFYEQHVTPIVNPITLTLPLRGNPTLCDEGVYLTKRFHPVHQQEELVGAMLLRSSRTNGFS